MRLRQYDPIILFPDVKDESLPVLDLRILKNKIFW